MLERIGAVNFRCLKDYALVPSAGTNAIVGDNGAGKTSILESIFLLGRGRSFRTAGLAAIATTGQTAFAVRGSVLSPEGTDTTLGLKWVQGRTTGQVDGREADGLAELARRFPVEVIDTQVQELVRGGPGKRRRFLDFGVFHVEQGFMAAWRRYSRALRQRNAALRQEGGGQQAAARAWNAELVAAGQLLDAARRSWVGQLSEDLGDLVEDLLGAPISISYSQGWPAALTLEEALARVADRDTMRGSTTVGPHRADLEIRFEEQPAREHCSGGQQKLIACALVLAQVRLVGESLGHPPVLLIDDPGAEVADPRLDRLMGWAHGLCDQRFVTGLAADVIGAGADALFHVEQGAVRRVK